jgi:hypothetical protein
MNHLLNFITGLEIAFGVTVFIGLEKRINRIVRRNRERNSIVKEAIRSIKKRKK